MLFDARLGNIGAELLDVCGDGDRLDIEFFTATIRNRNARMAYALRLVRGSSPRAG